MNSLTCRLVRPFRRLCPQPDADDPAVKTFLANLKKSAPDIEPTFFTTYAYAAMMLIGDAIRDAGDNPTRASVVAALEKWNPHNSPLLGPIYFSKTNHDGKRSVYILTGSSRSSTRRSGSALGDGPGGH